MLPRFHLCVYIFFKSFIDIQLLKSSLYPFHFTKACLFLLFFSELLKFDMRLPFCWVAFRNQAVLRGRHLWILRILCFIVLFHLSTTLGLSSFSVEYIVVLCLSNNSLRCLLQSSLSLSTHRYCGYLPSLNVTFLLLLRFYPSIFTEHINNHKQIFIPLNPFTEVQFAYQQGLHSIFHQCDSQ